MERSQDEGTLRQLVHGEVPQLHPAANTRINLQQEEQLSMSTSRINSYVYIYMYLGEEVVVAMATGEACMEEGEDVGAALAEQLSELLTPSVAKMEGAVVNLARERGRAGRQGAVSGARPCLLYSVFHVVSL